MPYRYIQSKRFFLLVSLKHERTYYHHFVDIFFILMMTADNLNEIIKLIDNAGLFLRNPFLKAFFFSFIYTKNSKIKPLRDILNDISNFSQAALRI